MYDLPKLLCKNYNPSIHVEKSYIFMSYRKYFVSLVKPVSGLAWFELDSLGVANYEFDVYASLLT